MEKKTVEEFLKNKNFTLSRDMMGYYITYSYLVSLLEEYASQSAPKEGYILPTEEEAGIYAVKISEEQGLSAQEQSFVIAGFTECIKWLNWLKLTTQSGKEGEDEDV